MKTIIRLTENDLHNIIRHAVNESLNTIRLQLINGYFYPTDAISSRILNREFDIDKIPEEKINVISPKIVSKGYKLAISDYDPTPTNRPSSFGSKIGGEAKPQQNPCKRCGFNGLCDSDECGKKTYRLFSKK